MAASLRGPIVHMLRVRLLSGLLWPIHRLHMAVRVTLIRHFLCTQNKISIWPMEMAQLGGQQLPTALFVRHWLEV